MEAEKIDSRGNLRMIVAVNNEGFIGLMGSLPWRCSADLKHFKRMTEGHKCILGRITYESLPPLKNREMLVVGTGHLTIDEALDQAGPNDWIIGGNKTYEALLPYCKEVHISVINDLTHGDTRFLENVTDDWKYYMQEWLYSGDGRSMHIYNFEPNAPKPIEIEKVDGKENS